MQWNSAIAIRWCMALGLVQLACDLGDDGSTSATGAGEAETSPSSEGEDGPTRDADGDGDGGGEGGDDGGPNDGGDDGPQGGDDEGDDGAGDDDDGGNDSDGGDPPGPTDDRPPAGNPDGSCQVPAEGQAEDVSSPDRVVGTGTPESCTGAAFVDAVAHGGVITFDCGPDPVTIVLDQTAKVFNDASPKVVIDGGNKVTLSGGGNVRILYQNTCDEAQVWTTAHCDNQDHPRLTVQNITFVDGNSTGDEPDGGGAIFARGGQLKIVNARFFNNRCDEVGPDVGGAAVRAFDQYQGKSLYVVNSTFGGAPEYGNECSNGGGLSSIGVSYRVYNSLFSHNRALGDGANPAKPGTPGGGSGGAIYNDGNTYTLELCGTKIEDNHANEGGGAIFFVSNDRTGWLKIRDSVLRRNPSDGFETAGYPGIFVLAAGDPEVVNSTIE